MLPQAKSSIHHPKILVRLPWPLCRENEDGFVRSIGSAVDGYIVGMERLLGGTRLPVALSRSWLMIEVNLVESPKILQSVASRIRKSYEPAAIAFSALNKRESLVAVRYILPETVRLLVNVGHGEANLAESLSAGIDGVLCTGAQTRRMRLMMRNKLVVSTMIKPDGLKRHDQEASVSDAVSNGASAIVLSDSVFYAVDRGQCLASIRRLADAAFASRIAKED